MQIQSLLTQLMPAGQEGAEQFAVPGEFQSVLDLLKTQFNPQSNPPIVGSALGQASLLNYTNAPPWTVAFQGGAPPGATPTTEDEEALQGQPIAAEISPDSHPQKQQTQASAVPLTLLLWNGSSWIKPVASSQDMEDVSACADIEADACDETSECGDQTPLIGYVSKTAQQLPIFMYQIPVATAAPIMSGEQVPLGEPTEMIVVNGQRLESGQSMDPAMLREVNLVSIDQSVSVRSEATPVSQNAQIGATEPNAAIMTAAKSDLRMTVAVAESTTGQAKNEIPTVLKPGKGPARLAANLASEPRVDVAPSIVAVSTPSKEQNQTVTHQPGEVLAIDVPEVSVEASFGQADDQSGSDEAAPESAQEFAYDQAALDQQEVGFTTVAAGNEVTGDSEDGSGLNAVTSTHHVASARETRAVHESQASTISQDELKSAVTQITDRLHVLSATRNPGTVTLHLEPENLGQVALTLREFNGRVDTEIVASNRDLSAALSANKSQLIQSAESKGIQLGSLTVGQQSAGEQQARQQAQQHAQEDFQRYANVKQWLSEQPPTVEHRSYGSVGAQAVDYII